MTYITHSSSALFYFYFLEYTAIRAEGWRVHVNISWLENLQCFLAPPTVTCPLFFFLAVRYRSGYRQFLWELGKGAVCKARGCAATEPVLCFSLEITVSLTLTHTQPGGDGGKRRGAEGSGVRGMMVDLRHKLWNQYMHYLKLKHTLM